MSTPSFYTDELRRALDEQSSAISSYSITGSAPLSATASVTLLEGRTTIITLRNEGYSLQSGDGHFETLEALLQSVSPLYARRRNEILLKALERLSGNTG